MLENSANCKRLVDLVKACDQQLAGVVKQLAKASAEQWAIVKGAVSGVEQAVVEAEASASWTSMHGATTCSAF